jgi:hypothetical protein
MVSFADPNCDYALDEQECCAGRSFAAIGIADGGNYILITPLDCENPTDPPVYEIDHHDPKQELLDPVPLSEFLAALEPEESDRVDFR